MFKIVMKRIFIALLFLKIALGYTKTEVYICGTKGAKKYHYSEHCRGLNACKHEITKTTRSKAEELGLTLCGWED
jgi:hypothetical protein